MSQTTIAPPPAPGMGALFDLSFTRFLTVSVIRVLYILGMVLIAIGWLFAVATAFIQGGFFAGVIGLLVVTILSAVQLLFLRVWLELIVVIFRIGENTTTIARGYDGGPTGGFPVTPVAQPTI